MSRHHVWRVPLWAALVGLLTSCGTTPEPRVVSMPGGIEGFCPATPDPVLRRGELTDPRTSRDDRGSLAILVTAGTTGTPLRDVQVELGRDSIRFTERPGQLTDRTGSALWSDLPSSTYWLRFRMIGYISVRSSVSVRSGATDTLLVQMWPAPVGCASRY